MTVLVIEPNRVMAQCIAKELAKDNMSTVVVSSAEGALEYAAEHTPDAVITEMSLPGHSGLEFIYEFRSYSEWQDIPLVINTSVKIPGFITQTFDWDLLNITEYIYKPKRHISDLRSAITLH